MIFFFDRLGFQRHQSRFDPESIRVGLNDKVALITGANAGLGLETARALARQGAETWLLCRNEARGQQALAQLRTELPTARLHLATVDMSERASIEALVKRLDLPKVDILIHNAGVLPLKLERSSEGFEQTVATHIVGPALLNRLLQPRLEASGAGRIIFVSSGGMYLKRLDLQSLLEPAEPYSGVQAYANTKRAQVILTEMLADHLRDRGITVNCMHPGWADTAGVQTSLPRFHRLTRALLRTPHEGADTVIWLAMAPELTTVTGRFFFDRQAVSTYWLPGTRESDEDRRTLWRLYQHWSLDS